MIEKKIILKKPGVGKILLPGLDCKKATNEIIKGIISYLKLTKGKGVVIGLSGGIDSSLTAILCKKAIDNIMQTTKKEFNFYALFMPSKETKAIDLSYINQLIKILRLKKINVSNNYILKQGFYIIEIDKVLKTIVNSFPSLFKLESGKSISYENLQSRIRMCLLYGLKESNVGLRVVGTGNRDEDYCLGYFTKYGDGGVDFSPIGNLSKRLVVAISKFNGVPIDIINKPPSAGLRRDQTDELDLGCSYFQAELIIAAKYQDQLNNLFSILRFEITNNNLSNELKKQLTGIDKKMVENVLYRHNVLTPHKLKVPPVMGIKSFIY